MIIMRKKYLIIIIILIFIISIIVRYSPVFHKGYSYRISTTNLVLAKNLSLVNKYSFESDKNVVLSSSLIKKDGVSASTSNKLTPVIYSKIFNTFGLNTDIPLYVSLFLYGITTILLFLLILKLSNLKIALIFAGIDIFIPFVLSGTIWFGFYEWAMLFFIIAIFIYLWKNKPSGWRLLLSGVFFGLAALARNAFVISFVPFLIYDFYSNVLSKYNWKSIGLWIWPVAKRVFIFALPVVLLFGGFMIQDYLSEQNNTYLDKSNIKFDSHLFPDPYTYHFDKENFINQIKTTAQGDQINALIAYGYLDDWKVEVKMRVVSLIYYIKNFLRLPTMGGIVSIFFLILGTIFLYKNKRKYFILFVLWGVIWLFCLVGLKTTNVDHFLEIRFPLVILMSLGVYASLKFIWDSNLKTKSKHLLIIGLLLVVFFHLIHANRWMFHEQYLYSKTEEKIELLETINKSDLEIVSSDVIAVPDKSVFLNYYTDFNYISFRPATIEKLLKENKLQWAFDQFGVTHIAGFKDLNREITKATKIISF